MITVAVDELFTSWLLDQLDSLVVGVSSERPAKLESTLPWVVVRRGGGGDRDFALDAPVMDIDVFAGDNTSTAALARAVDSSFRYNTPAAWRGAQLTFMRCNQGPTKVSDVNSAVKHYASIYTFSLQ